MTDKEVSDSVLRSIESHLRDNPMSHDNRDSEDNSGERQHSPKVRDAVLGTMLPDLFASSDGKATGQDVCCPISPCPG
jgi:hypothetical protein